MSKVWSKLAILFEVLVNKKQGEGNRRVFLKINSSFHSKYIVSSLEDMERKQKL